MSEHYLVITSWPSADDARIQARRWLENKLAANVNILPLMDSMYLWKGEIRQGTEHRISITTTKWRLAELCQDIRNSHPYPLAEILQIELDSGDPDYLDWIKQSTL